MQSSRVTTKISVSMIEVIRAIDCRSTEAVMLMNCWRINTSDLDQLTQAAVSSGLPLGTPQVLTVKIQERFLHGTGGAREE